MNKAPVFLACACAAMLIAAASSLVFLLWQSWEDSRRLERQNLELHASLEASRIRIENFCEYPAETICPADTAYGKDFRRSESSASLAQSMQELPAPSQPSLSSAADQKDLAEQQQMLPAAPQAVSAVVPDENEAPAESHAPPSGNVPGNDQAAQGPSKAAVSHPAQDAHEDTAAMAPERRTSDSPSPSQLKRTWISLEQGQKGMVFRIAGADTEMHAFGELYSDRYEVFIEGLWNIRLRRPDTPCVNGMSRYFQDNNTVLVFPLRCLPEVNRVYNIDARTIGIEIR